MEMNADVFKYSSISAAVFGQGMAKLCQPYDSYYFIVYACILLVHSPYKKPIGFQTGVFYTDYG